MQSITNLLSKLRLTRKLKIITAISTILILFIAIAVIVLQNNQNKREAALLQTADSPTDKTLLIKLSISKDPEPQIGLKGVEQYNSRIDRPRSDNQDAYRFSLIKDDQLVYSSTFSMPTVHGESIDPETGQLVYLGASTQDSISFRTPDFPKGTIVEVRDSSGNIILTEPINEIKYFDNKADYETIRL